MAWFKITQFRDFIGEPVPAKKYKGLLNVLQRLNAIDPQLAPLEVRQTLYTFVRPGNPYASQPAPAVVDNLGRARGKGKRKTSSAVVFLVEGGGKIFVNGKDLMHAFPRLHDRESATWPLRCTQRLDKYNAWVVVRGGGVTGQAESTTLALARALLVHEPGLKPTLRKGTFVRALFVRKCERFVYWRAFSSLLICPRYSWCYYGRCTARGEKEARSRQGPQDAYLGQEVKIVSFPLVLYFLSCIMFLLWRIRLRLLDISPALVSIHCILLAVVAKFQLRCRFECHLCHTDLLKHGIRYNTHKLRKFARTAVLLPDFEIQVRNLGSTSHQYGSCDQTCPVESTLP